MQNETQPKAANGFPPEPGATRKLRRTLLLAGMFALLAMIYVPAPAQLHPFSCAHYRFIFSQDETGIAFFQLLVNVAFAVLVGALAANIPKRVFVWFQRCFLSKRALVVYFFAIVIAGLVLATLADQAKQARQRAEQKAAEARQAEQARRQTANPFDRFNQPYLSTDPNAGLDQSNWQNDPIVQPAQGPGQQVDLSGLPDQQLRRTEIDKENTKRATANQALAEKAFREHKLTLAQEYYRAAALCWRSANRSDLEEECIRKADRIGWVTKP